MGSLKGFHSRPGGRLEPVACCVCGGAPRPYAVDYHGNAIARCPRCRLRFVSPRAPLEALLEHTYDEDYYRGDMDPADARRDYERYLDDLGRWRRPPGLWLDIGAGDGSFLRAARDRGWSIEANEMGRAAAALRKTLGCPVHEGRVEDLKALGRYDMVSLIHVLEHLLDPRAVLESARALLKPGGLLFVAVPNTASLNDRLKSALSRARLKSRAWKHLAADHHLWFFDARTLGALARAAGYRPLSARSFAPSRRGRKAGAWGRAAEAAGLAPWLELVAARE